MNLARFPALTAIIIAGALYAGSAFTQQDDELEHATFAGGCFWCMEPPYDQVDGVVETISGFSGGHVADPSYQQVVQGGTGHLEVVQVIYDPKQVDYQQLLDIYWPNVDPFDGGGQFCDRGESYRPAIFVHDERQERLARQSLETQQARFDRPIEVTIEPFEAFYPAEDYHQNYYRENAVRYKYYRWRCGRDERLEEVWGDEADG
ncbi:MULTISPECIES: peptide-methionine (S)-S-oxide reductase MsrA [unclassified Wenzhouxiangella]|uniref:peptide-methionine (S)-S-oxide reductase MsrA n=1 Tax=unclassified Wenzhouxiangella TaxID=2613841 RepID=UPI000E32A59E|nr:MULTISPECIES: peptide-methionine (S)-S-oxide reductase MsrA [unclassified Wenzhouxiangella]RFF28473.1 peptide-methionine (S)-S-oxide reductase [Wenzhouxiangella sp. 15181]RFP69990.1 peptide-methionine (S)-S-oxide reductase [Wenzhouxiangella sp. 15190]